MNKLLKVTLFLTLLFTVMYGRTKVNPPEKKAVNYDQIIWIPNKCAASILNDGRIFHDPTNSLNPKNEAGLMWPWPLKNPYIFGSGVWVGCVERGDTLVSVGYNPNSGQSEFVPGLANMGTDPNNRIYDYPSDWPPPSEIFPMAPQENFSPNDIWFAFNDLDSTMHATGDTRPMGIEVYVTGYGWTQKANEDILFLTYTIKNVSGDTLRDMYMSVTVDPDIGYYRDDMVGLILDRDYEIEGETYHIDNVGVCYDSDGKEQGGSTYAWESGDPGCIAFDFLQSPYALHDGIDNDNDGLIDEQEVDSAYISTLYPNGDRDGDGVPDWRDPSEIEQLGMTAFKKFIIELDPDKDWKRYMMMAGYDLTGIYNPYDSIDVSPGDKRFLQATGPFDLPPESTATVVVAVIAAEFPGTGGFNDRDHSDLVKKSATAQFIFNMNWLLPAPPPSPNVTLIPGDNMVLITWDDFSETVPDPYYKLASDPKTSAYDPTYVEYDFEGYRVWKSTDGIEWKLLATFDKADGLTVDDSLLGIKAEDYGLAHSYIDRDSVVNGYTYYYTVTAFDYNYNSGVPFTLESGKKAYSVVPRRDPVNISIPLSDVEIPERVVSSPDSNKFALLVNARIVVPDSLKGNTIHIKFNGMQYVDQEHVGYPYEVYIDDNKVKEGVLVHNLKKSEVLLDFSSIGVEVSLIDTMNYIELSTYPERNVGTYDESKITVSTIKDHEWSYRGSDLRIVWRKEGANWTVSVYDATFNKEIPYKPFSMEGGAQNGDGWCFYSLKEDNPSQYIIVDETQALFISGVLILLNKGKKVTEEEVAMLKDGEEWTFGGNEIVAPLYSDITISLPEVKISEEETEFKVRVVPNPYIVTNNWEKDITHRQIAFYDLPDECTIRIYTIAGDLVKVIEHTPENGGTEFWNLLNENGQLVASGVYLFSVESKVGKYVGKIFIVH